MKLAFLSTLNIQRQLQAGSHFYMSFTVLSIKILYMPASVVNLIFHLIGKSSSNRTPNLLNVQIVETLVDLQDMGTTYEDDVIIANMCSLRSLHHGGILTTGTPLLGLYLSAFLDSRRALRTNQSGWVNRIKGVCTLLEDDVN